MRELKNKNKPNKNQKKNRLVNNNDMIGKQVYQYTTVLWYIIALLLIFQTSENILTLLKCCITLQPQKTPNNHKKKEKDQNE